VDRVDKEGEMESKKQGQKKEEKMNTKWIRMDKGKDKRRASGGKEEKEEEN